MSELDEDQTALEDMGLTAKDMQIEEEAAEEAVEEEVLEVNEDEAKAGKLGWMPKDEWDGDPDDWSSAKRFNQTRDIIESNKTLRSKIDSMENNFETRISGLQKIHSQNLELKIKELNDKKDLAASEADMETYDQAKKDLDELEEDKTPEPLSQKEVLGRIVNHPSTQKFIVENPWIKEKSAKGIYGQKVFSDWIQQNQNNENVTLEDGLAFIKASVDTEFAEKASTKPAMGDHSTGARKGGNVVRLTMNDLSSDEKHIWDTMGKTWKNAKEFLQSVADMRKGG